IKLCSDFYMNTLPDRSVTHVGKLYCHLCKEVQQLGEYEGCEGTAYPSDHSLSLSCSSNMREGSRIAVLS
ncbi:MAG: hypothetical protein WBE68_11995, partial [Candidatus Nitrosopolaris sp.]